MKNFRKVLALILVVATLFSFTAMASAAEYTDADKITGDYEVAVDVLSAIGILNGYTDGSFKPTQNIEREEMAKMVAVLSNAGDDVSELYASACTFADAKNSWAASYIAYCNQTGVIAGRSATTFDPDANVTGLETAKMLLCVLGFDAAEQGYIGSNWKVNVLRDAKNFGLLNGFAAGYDVSKAITREEAAQMFLNALQAPLVVGTLSNNVIKVSNALYLDGSRDAVSVVVKNDQLTTVNGIWNWTLKDAEKFGEVWTVLYGNVVVSNTPLASIYKGLVLDQGDEDCYGNPVNTWTYSNAKGTVLFSKSYAIAPDLKYTTTASSLAKDLKEVLESTHGYTYTWYEDGMKHPVSGVPEVYDADDLADIVGHTGNGVLTQVYVDDVNYTVTITIKHTYIGQVDYVTKQANTFTLTNGATYSNKDYGFKAGQVVLYWLCNGYKTQYTACLHDAKVAEPVEVTLYAVTSVGDDPAKSTVSDWDGNKYEYAFNFGNYASSTNYYGAVNGKKALNPDDLASPYYKLYLDEYGYIMLYRYNTYEAEVGYAYAVEGTAYAKDDGLDAKGQHSWRYFVDTVDFDGNLTEDVEIGWDVYGETVNRYDRYDSVNDIDHRGTGLLYCYTVYEDVQYGEYVYGLQKWATVADADATLTAAGDLVKNGAVVVPGTDETKYLVRTYDYENGAYVYTPFTGSLDKSYAGYVYDYDMASKVATIQYFTDGRGYLEYVFVDAIYTVTAQRAFVLGYKESFSNWNLYWEFGAGNAYEAYINGEKSILLTTHAQNLSDLTLYQANLECLGVTHDGMKVYSQVDVNAAWKQTVPEAYLWYEGRLEVVVGDTVVPGNSYHIAEDAFAVVVVLDEDGKVEDAARLEGVENINDFFESAKSVAGQGEENYLPVKGTIVTNGLGQAAEIYIIVD